MDYYAPATNLYKYLSSHRARLASQLGSTLLSASISATSALATILLVTMLSSIPIPISALLALLSFAEISLAVPSASEHHHHRQCLDRSAATYLARSYGSLISNYSLPAASALLTANFTDYSESVNTLINSCPQGGVSLNLPLLAPTFTSLAQFEAAQGNQPSINFELLNLWHSCSEVIIRWMTTNTANASDVRDGYVVKPVVGLIVLETVLVDGEGEAEGDHGAAIGRAFPRKIDRVFSELDAAAWLQNLQAAGICKEGAEGVPDAGGAASPSPSPSSASSSSCETTSTPVFVPPYNAVVPAGSSVVVAGTAKERLMV